MTLYMVEVRMRDWPSGFAWYRDVLGLEPTKVDEPNRFAMFLAGQVRLAIKAGDPVDAQRDAINLVFQVGDVESAREKLLAKGVSVSDVIDSEYNEGYKEIRFQDPEGTQIRLFTWRTALE